MSATAAAGERLCALRAAAARHDPIGAGAMTPRILAVEMPTPWREGLYAGDPAGTIQERMWAVREAAFARIRRRADSAQVFAAGVPGLYGIAPDPEWSDPAFRRALLFTRPEGAFARFEAAEYRFPVESPLLVDLVRAFFEAPGDLLRFEAQRVPRGAERDFFVCTHGQVDICCATFGIPLYRQACAAYPAVRAWRITHFGGHRYAPTAWEFPSGYRWAFLDEEAARRVLRREGPTADLRLHVRGWSGVSSRVQLLDRVGLERFGWDWLAFRRSGEELETDAEARRWRVRLAFEGPSGEAGAYEGVVVVRRELHDAGCGPHWGEHAHVAPEYALESMTASPPEPTTSPA